MSDQGVTWVNGRILAPAEPGLSPADRGFLYGDGVFETLRAYSGRPFRMSAHLHRLSAGAHALRIRIPHPLDELASIVRAVLADAVLLDAYVRITLSRGIGGLPSQLDAAEHATLVVHARPFSGYSGEMYDRGARACLSSVRRNETSPLSGIKTLNYLDSLLLRADARDRGYDEAIMLNTRGHVAECTASNIFIVSGTRLLTPPLSDGLLPGITRATVLELARRGQSPFAEVNERTLGLEEVRQADEAFLTNSLMEVMPLVAVDQAPIADGVPGPRTLALLAAYRDLVRLEAATN